MNKKAIPENENPSAKDFRIRHYNHELQMMEERHESELKSVKARYESEKNRLNSRFADANELNDKPS
mgnify:FL=1